MKVIIVGCGKVGYTLAETLSNEGHDITVIDHNAQKLKGLANNIDVQYVLGNGASYRVLREAGVDVCDLVIAATSQDEVNMLCCMFARKAGRCRTIARVRNPDYYQDLTFIQDDLGLSMAINPEFSAAMACYHLIRTPGAVDLDSFAKGKAQILTTDLPSHSQWVGQRLMDVAKNSSVPFLLSMIIRDQNVLIPHGGTVLNEGDRISLMVELKNMPIVLRQLGIQTKPIRSVLVIGGDTMSYYLARKLSDAHIKVKIIEPNRARCIELSDQLPRVTVINGIPTDERLLLEEGIETTDAVCALLKSDVENIMIAVYASKRSDAKVITRVNKATFGGVINELPIGSVITPKALTAETIIRYVRTMRRPSVDSDIEYVYRLADDRVEAISFLIKGSSRLTSAAIQDLPIKPGILINAIIRKNHVIIPSGRDQIQPGDEIIIITTRRGISDISDILKA
jgi:trk system potassium uptake protein TrkA